MLTIPSFFDFEKRDKFMTNNSSDYSSIKWVNQNISNDVTILSHLKSISLYKNKAFQVEALTQVYGNKSKYVDFLRSNKPKFFVTSSLNTLDNLIFANCLGDLYKESDELLVESRNPFNRSVQKIRIYFFKYENLDFCIH